MGHVFERSGWWYLRYNDNVVQEDGTVRRAQLSKRLAPVSKDYPTERSVRCLAEEFLLPINSGKLKPESTMTLAQFVRDVYHPHIEREKRPSTVKTYKDMWSNHIKPRAGDIRLREFRTCDGERIMREIARSKPLNRTSLHHIKSQLSAIFKHAKRSGALDGVNPMQDVSVPRAPTGNSTFAYPFETILDAMAVLSEREAAVVAVAGFAGLRKGEIMGLQVEDYSDGYLKVRRAIWNGIVDAPKTSESMNDVPVIEIVATALDRYLESPKRFPGKFLFSSPSGRPLHLDNLARRVIKPAFKKAGIPWYGWHAFRRGLGTNLDRLGAQPKTIQKILRHSDYSTTMNSYVKGFRDGEWKAMEALNEVCTEYAAEQQKKAEHRVVN